MNDGVVLPAGWRREKLLTAIKPRREKRSPQSVGDLPFVGMENVEAQTMKLLGTVPAATMKSSAAAFYEDDVIYGRLRPYLNKVCKPGFKGLCSSEFIVFPEQPHLCSSYLQYRLNASDFVRFSSRINAGDRPRVDFEQIGEFEIELPPPKQQKKIVEKIEELFSDLDAGVAALKRAQANLKRYRAAVLKAAVEGRLTAQWRAQRKAKGIATEPAAKLLERILAERRKKWEAAQLKKYADASKAPPKGWQTRYPDPAVPDASDLPELPEAWCWATVEQCAGFESNAITDGPFGSNLKSEHYTDSGARVIRLQNIGDGEFVDAIAYVSMDHYEKLRKHAIRRGDLVIAMLGEKLPRACVVPDDIEPAIVKADCVKVTPNPNAVSSKFLNFYLNSEPVRTRESRNIKGVGRPRLNVSHMRQVVLSLPSPYEQAEIVSEVEAKLSNIAQAETEIKRSLERAARLRQAILKRAFEGRLV